MEAQDGEMLERDELADDLGESGKRQEEGLASGENEFVDGRMGF